MKKKHTIVHRRANSNFELLITLFPHRGEGICLAMPEKLIAGSINPDADIEKSKTLLDIL